MDPRVSKMNPRDTRNAPKAFQMVSRRSLRVQKVRPKGSMLSQWPPRLILVYFSRLGSALGELWVTWEPFGFPFCRDLASLEILGSKVGLVLLKLRTVKASPPDRRD